jgi:uncharacterized protein (TIGR02118 family)
MSDTTLLAKPRRSTGDRPAGSEDDFRDPPSLHLQAELSMTAGAVLPALPSPAYRASMTVKLVVLYTRPDDADAFDRHYLDVHMPLVNKLPGLQRAETGRIVTALDGGEQSYFRVAELYFADQPALGAAFTSAEGKATAADYQQIAPPGSRMFVETLDD